MSKEKNRVVAIRLSEDDWQFLRKYAFHRELPKSRIVKDLLKGFIEKEKANAQTEHA